MRMSLAVGSVGALALMVVALGPVSARAYTEDPAPVVNQVKLEVQISGLGADGCQVEIRPANPACKFEPIVQRIDRTPADGVVRLDSLAIAASSRSADRECSFAITVTEPGGQPQTFKRSVRLALPKEPGSTPEISQVFYLRNTAVARRDPPTRRP